MTARLGRTTGPGRPVGFAILVVVGVLAVVYALGVAYSQRTGSHLFATTHVLQATQARYLAESGVIYAQRVARAWKAPHSEKLSFDSGSTTIELEDLGGARVLIAAGRCGSVTHEIAVLLDPRGGIILWRESTR